MECTVNGVIIYYEIHGEGIPIIMLHGWPVDHRMMKGCMEPVFKAVNTAWKRIYFDLPGRGKTSGEQCVTGQDQIFDLVLGFIDAIIPEQNFVLVGESYGGYLARGIINKRPSAVDGLLLICPQIDRETSGDNGGQYKVLEKDNELINSIKEEDRAYFEAKGINAIQNKRVWERFSEEVLPALKTTEYEFIKKCCTMLSFDVDALEKPYMKPTLMLAGRQDSVVGYRGLWKLIELYPRASFVLLDRAAHALKIEQDVVFTEIVREWLNRIALEIG